MGPELPGDVIPSTEEEVEKILGLPATRVSPTLLSFFLVLDLNELEEGRGCVVIGPGGGMVVEKVVPLRRMAARLGVWGNSCSMGLRISS